MRRLIVPLLLLVLAACGPATPAPASPTAAPAATRTRQPTGTPYARIPEQVDDGWETAAAAEAGLDPRRLTRMLAAIYRGPGRRDTPTLPGGAPKFENIHSLLIVRGGRLVLEEYFYHYGRTDRHDTYSATKSVTSLLVGLAIEQGHLEGVDERIAPYFPDYDPSSLDGRWGQVTIEDLLTMRAGLECNDWSPASRTYYRGSFGWNSRDFVLATFGLPFVTDPGLQFSYCSPATVLLGALLERATGMPLEEYANRNLFAPLGLARMSYLELPGGWDDAAGSIFMRPREMARIGLMVLQGGRWDGVQVVPQAWLQRSTEEHVALEFNAGWGSGYGYLWWLSQVQVGGRTIRSVSASGFGGQVITVFPDLDMVVVMTGGNFENDEGQPFQIMEGYLLPAVLP